MIIKSSKLRLILSKSSLYLAGIIVIGGLATCGSEKKNMRSEGTENSANGSGGSGGGGITKPSAGQVDDDSIVKGRWEIVVKSSGETLSFGITDVSRGTGSAAQPIAGVVAANVKFTVSNTNFSTPETDGIASYGTLDVTQLNDNALRVCGPQRNQKCVEGEIRVFSSGTKGPGLWSDIEGYGLPILSGSTIVGLGSGNAASIKKSPIAASATVLKLKDFTSDKSLQIPINVNFTDAAAGSYSTTLTVEYVVR